MSYVSFSSITSNNIFKSINTQSSQILNSQVEKSWKQIWKDKSNLNSACDSSQKDCDVDFKTYTLFNNTLSMSNLSTEDYPSDTFEELIEKVSSEASSYTKRLYDLEAINFFSKKNNWERVVIYAQHFLNHSFHPCEEEIDIVFYIQAKAFTYLNNYPSAWEKFFTLHTHFESVDSRSDLVSINLRTITLLSPSFLTSKLCADYYSKIANFILRKNLIFHIDEATEILNAFSQVGDKSSYTKLIDRFESFIWSKNQIIDRIQLSLDYPIPNLYKFFDDIQGKESIDLNFYLNEYLQVNSNGLENLFFASYCEDETSELSMKIYKYIINVFDVNKVTSYIPNYYFVSYGYTRIQAWNERSNDPSFLYQIGVSYFEGSFGITPNSLKAQYYLKEATRYNHAGAFYYLGRLTNNLSYYQEAYKLNHPEAALYLFKHALKTEQDLLTPSNIELFDRLWQYYNIAMTKGTRYQSWLKDRFYMLLFNLHPKNQDLVPKDKRAFYSLQLGEILKISQKTIVFPANLKLSKIWLEHAASLRNSDLVEDQFF